MVKEINRTETSKALAKVLAYLAVGKREDAEYWWNELYNLIWR